MAPIKGTEDYEMWKLAWMIKDLYDQGSSAEEIADRIEDMTLSEIKEFLYLYKADLIDWSDGRPEED